MRALAVILVFLAGCANTPSGGGSGSDIGQARASWQGASYDDLVRTWGAPARSTKMPDGRDAHTWVSETVVSRSSFWPSIGIFGGSGGIGIGTGVTMGGGPAYGGDLQRCERTLFFENGRVVDQAWQGPGDYCAGFRRG